MRRLIIALLGIPFFLPEISGHHSKSTFYIKPWSLATCPNGKGGL
jgi:hypothetical protein